MCSMILRGNALNLPLAGESIHCCVTSPPYYGLRAYEGVAPSDWPEIEYVPMSGLPPVTVPEMTCCLGMEPTPEAFIGHLVLVFREVKRVLRDDAVAWVNMGDSFNSSPSNQQSGSAHRPYHENNGTGRVKRDIPGLKPKDLCMIPARLALALQGDGWWLRSDVIWAKGLSFCESYAGSCMPESVTDRPTSAHEHLFLLAKAPRYYYDNEAVKEPATAEPHAPGNTAAANWREIRGLAVGKGMSGHLAEPDRTWGTGTRNLRNVWAINPAGFPGAHFATMPPALVEPCIKAGTSERGCCPVCGAPWERVVEKERQPRGDAFGRKDIGGYDHGQAGAPYMETVAAHTLGWQPTCGCPAHEPVPCVVLDPFSGAGTTGLVADRLGRRYVGVELSPEYCRMGRERIIADAPLFAMNYV